MSTLDERAFWRMVEPTGSCWLWKGYTNHGYGLMAAGATKVRVHRVAYELLVGPIPEGLVIDHLCRVRHCVNPDHLEPVTNAENVRRGFLARGRGYDPNETADEQCRNGHYLTEDNTYVRPDRKRRVCRRCKDEQVRRRRARLSTRLTSAA